MSNDRARGELFVLSAPSGAGKTTLIHRLMSKHPTAAEHLAFSISHTTRPPRPGEVDGRDYWFTDRQTFEHKIAAEFFLEWAVVHDELYGTGRESVEARLEEGEDVLLDVDVQGAAEVRRRSPEVRSIFILPPSFADLEARLRRRAQDGEKQIRLRLDTALSEARRVGDYDYVILNADVDRAAEALAAILIAHRQSRERQRRRVEAVLASFGLDRSTSTVKSS